MEKMFETDDVISTLKKYLIERFTTLVNSTSEAKLKSLEIKESKDYFRMCIDDEIEIIIQRPKK